MLGSCEGSLVQVQEANRQLDLVHKVGKDFEAPATYNPL